MKVLFISFFFILLQCASIETYSAKHQSLSEQKDKIVILPCETSKDYDKNFRNDCNLVDSYVRLSLDKDNRFVPLIASDETFLGLYSDYKEWIRGKFGLTPTSLNKFMQDKYKTQLVLLPILFSRPNDFSFKAESSMSEKDSGGGYKTKEYKTSVHWTKGSKLGIRYQIMNFNSGEILRIQTIYTQEANFDKLQENFLALNETMMNKLLKD